MSHYTRIATQLTDTAILLQALADVLGIDASGIEQHNEPVVLTEGWGMDQSGRAHLVVRRHDLAHLQQWRTSDLGFLRGEDGTYTVVAEGTLAYDFAHGWGARLTQRYAVHTAKAQLHAQGFTLVSEETDDDGTIRLIANV